MEQVAYTQGVYVRLLHVSILLIWLLVHGSTGRQGNQYAPVTSPGFKAACYNKQTNEQSLDCNASKPVISPGFTGLTYHTTMQHLHRQVY